MRSAHVVLLLQATLLAACEPVAGPAADARQISWGSSFNMCVGYCRQELQVTPTEVRLVESSWNTAQLPTRVSTRPFTRPAWDSLVAAVDDSGIDGLAETYGCPDCADGGAEWVAVDGPHRKRVTFEYNRSPLQLQPVVAQLRSIRAGISH